MWSPYYRIVAEQFDLGGGETGLNVQVNGVPHQVARSVEGSAARRPAVRHPVSSGSCDGAPGNVLVVGAGTGNDVALALARGATHVDAVEIDPKILDLGRRLHPDRPYEDPRVTTHVDDGRAFLERTNERYDLVLFALPDSLALVTGGGAIRLESYLFTREAMAAVRRHLTERGGFAMYNFYREQWLVDRYAGTVASAFGHEPCVDEVQREVRPGRDLGRASTRADQRCARRRSSTRPASHRQPTTARSRTSAAVSCRRSTCFALAAILLASFVSRSSRRRAVPRDAAVRRPLLHGRCLPPARDEEHHDVRAAVRHDVDRECDRVRGGARCRAPRGRDDTPSPNAALPVLYLGIAAALALAYVIPNASLLALSVSPRLIAATALAFAPIYLANLAFAKRFSDNGERAGSLRRQRPGRDGRRCIDRLEVAIRLAGER